MPSKKVKKVKKGKLPPRKPANNQKGKTKKIVGG